MGFGKKALEVAKAGAEAYANRDKCPALVRDRKGTHECGKPVKRGFGTCGLPEHADWLFRHPSGVAKAPRNAN